MLFTTTSYNLVIAFINYYYNNYKTYVLLINYQIAYLQRVTLKYFLFFIFKKNIFYITILLY